MICPVVAPVGLVHVSVSANPMPFVTISTTSSNAAPTAVCVVASLAVAVLASPLAKLIAASVSVS